MSTSFSKALQIIFFLLLCHGDTFFLSGSSSSHSGSTRNKSRFEFQAFFKTHHTLGYLLVVDKLHATVTTVSDNQSNGDVYGCPVSKAPHHERDNEGRIVGVTTQFRNLLLIHLLPRGNVTDFCLIIHSVPSVR